MPILVILFLTATCLPVEWPAPLLGPVAELTVGASMRSTGGATQTRYRQPPNPPR